MTPVLFEVDAPSYYVAFLAGLVSFLSPCIIPLIPLYLSYITGESIESINKQQSNVSYSTILKAMFFGLGFGFVFVMLGVFAYSLSSVLGHYKSDLYIAAGVLTAIMGLMQIGVIFNVFNSMLGRFQILSKPVIAFQSLMNNVRNKNDVDEAGSKNFAQRTLAYALPFVFGVVVSITWTPCVGPILSAVLSLVMVSSSFASGVELLITYSVGLWIPFLVMALMINSSVIRLNFIKRHFNKIKIVSGVILILFGVLIASGKLEVISEFIPDFSTYFDGIIE